MNKNKGKSVFTFFSNLIRKNSFLKVLSILLAIVVWIYILYIVNPVNAKTYSDVTLTIPYAGSVPQRNGFMYLMSDTNLTVRVTVSGSRSKLLMLSENDLKATLNLDSVVSAGTYHLPVTVSLNDESLTVSDIYPENFTVEFAERVERTLPVELHATGSLPDGYAIDETALSPDKITVSGPKSTVESIANAYLSVSLTNIKADISGNYELLLADAAGNNVDRRYLTVSDESIVAAMAIRYRKTMDLTTELTNVSGGSEESYISVSLNEKQITATGEERLLTGYTDFPVGPIDTSTITKNGDIVLPVPQIDGVTFNLTEVVAHVEFTAETGTKTLHFSVPDDVTFINVPAEKTIRTESETLNIRIRALSADLRRLTKENLSCIVDLEHVNADGSYPVLLTTSSGIPFGVLGSYSVRLVVN